jgi:hypothetical protein
MAVEINTQDWHVDEDGEITCNGAVIGSVLQADDFPCLDEADRPAIEAECKAFGQLIADAPKLLAALEAAMGQWRAYHSLQNDHDIEDEKSEEADIYRVCAKLVAR